MLLMCDIRVGEWVWIKLVNGTKWKKIMDSNPIICEDKLTTNNPNRKWGFIKKQSQSTL